MAFVVCQISENIFGRLLEGSDLKDASRFSHTMLNLSPHF